ncbi:MAG: anti-sigma factor [Actinomycetota bacterium]|nr:anti-sigma factor [Actinomycetota bacterium]
MTETHSNAYAYVIGALTASEAQEFERHLIECAACAEEVADARAIASALSTVVAAEPPAHLRASVLAAIAHTSQEEIATVTALTRPSSAPAESPGPASGSASVAPIRSSRRSRATSLLSAAAVVAAVGFGGWAVQSSQELGDTRQAAEAAVKDAKAANQAVAEAAGERAKLTSLLTAADVQTVSGRFISSDDPGAVVMSADRQMAVLVASGLPKLPESKVYEAWTINGEPAPAGIFRSDGSNAVVELSDAAFDADSIAVTIEPAGGSPKPTGDAVFNVNLPRA